MWPRDHADRAREMLDPDALAFQKRFAFTQLLMNGTTTASPIAVLPRMGRNGGQVHRAADAAEEMGLRVFLSPAFLAGGMVLCGPGQMAPTFDEARGLDGLRQAVSFIAAQDGRDGLIRGMLAPDPVGTCTKGLLRATDAAACDLGCKIQLHMA